MERVYDYDWTMVLDKIELTVPSLQFNAEIGVPFHGRVDGVAQNLRIDQVAHANADPDRVGMLLA